jgi:hypothetical protein
VLDDVDHARHYNTHPSGIECITISECLPGGLQSAFEYVWRHEHKGNPVQDLDKALWRLLREDATYKAHPIRYVALLRDGICLRGEGAFMKALYAVRRAENSTFPALSPLGVFMAVVLDLFQLGHPVGTDPIFDRLITRLAAERDRAERLARDDR